MKTEKRIIHANGVYPALHTESGFVPYANLEIAERDLLVKTSYKKGDRYYLQININKSIPGSMVRSYSEYQAVKADLLERIEASEMQTSRVDLSFNWNSPEHYEEFKKLHKLLICCVAESTGARNCYQAFDLWTDRSLSVAVKTDRFEIENYHKALEAKETSETKNRLELRSKRVTGSIETEFKEIWFNRLDRAIDSFEAVQQHYNSELIRIWSEDIQKPPKDRDFISITAFILRYKNCIFSRKQLQSFLEQIGVKNPENRAKKIKEKHRIEFFSLTDLRNVVKTIKIETMKYFNS